MSLPAHTNSVGTHSLTSFRIGWVDGESDYDNDNVYNPYRYWSHAKEIETARSVKSVTMHGDKTHALPYRRSIRRVMRDEPYLTRSRLFGGSHLIYDETVEHYISILHTPFIYDPGKGAMMHNAQAEADVEALNDLGEAKAQLGADLAQLRQTVDMFSDNAAQLAKALLAAKRGRWRDIPAIFGVSRKAARSGRSSSTAANRWLEAQYGWLPLMGSIHDVQQVLHKDMSANRKISGKGRAKYKTSGGFPYRQELWTEETSARVRTHLIAKLASPSLARLNSFGLVNPLSIAWELVPWSFVIDWFVPVGQTLEAITATYGLDFVDGYQSRHHDYTLTSYADIEQYPYNGYDGITKKGEYVERGYDFEREVYSDFPQARFFADLTPFSTPRALNALALVRQLSR